MKRLPGEVKPRVAVPSRRPRRRLPVGGVLRPGPALARPAADDAACDADGAVDELDARQALGMGSSSRRLRAYADYLEVVAWRGSAACGGGARGVEGAR